jgi:IclR family acetate operon transcriptional repressor
MPDQTSLRREGPQSVGRVIAILEYLAENKEGVSLAELATFAQAPKTSLVGLLAALVQEECLRRNDAGKYVLAERIYGLASRVRSGQELVTLARPFIRELMLGTGETVVLGVVADDADMVTYVDKVESDNPVRYTITVGERREMYCTSMGKALLAYAGPEQLRRVLAPRALRAFTMTTITSPETLQEELEEILRTANGWRGPAGWPHLFLGQVTRQ